MDSDYVFVQNSNNLPDWAKNHSSTEVKKLKKLEVKVEMCCSTCVEKVEEAVSGMPGVFEYKTERYNSRLIITETPSGGPNRKHLVNKLKKATHDKKVEILGTLKEASSTPASSSATTATTVVYRNPFIANLGGGLVPWPPSGALSSSFITNPNYLQHLVGCSNCRGYPGAVCASCGRSSGMGAMFP